MKLFPAFAVLLWVGTAVLAKTAQAGPPQPVIQLPQRPAATGPNPGPAADPQLDPDLGRKLATVGGGCVGDGTGYVRARSRGALNMDVNWQDRQLTCSGEARPMAAVCV